MAWSTRELAALAGVTLRAVRHYHQVGLLDEPRRQPNGYKSYGVEHLLRVLRIRHLVDLGFGLSEIARMPRRSPDLTEDLRRLDADLVAAIRRLQDTRARVAELLAHPSEGLDLTGRLSPLADGALTESDRAFLAVVARVVSPEVLQEWVEMTRASHRDPVLAELDTLPADADEEARAELARRMAPHLRRIRRAHPRLEDPTADSPVGVLTASQTINLATRHLYNDAQLDVARRAHGLAHGETDALRGPAPTERRSA